MNLNKLLQRPESVAPSAQARYERFGLVENPFPAQPVVNKDSEDKRLNGDIYEAEIRTKEFEQVKNHFLVQPQSDPNHLRLGYIIDTSFIGRGNGKSAFLVNLQQSIEENYSFNFSEGKNRCFALTITPQLGGRTKTFVSFIDLLFTSILDSNIISTCLATLRLEAIGNIYPSHPAISALGEVEDPINALNSDDWFAENKMDVRTLNAEVLKNEHITKLPSDFPLHDTQKSLFAPLSTEADFRAYYQDEIKKPEERIKFIFTDLVRFFQAARFNGAYILVDDFERIPDFQSARQKKDFALELRSCLFDGIHLNARVGFYNFLLVLHAGVPNMIADAWETSGMEHRSPVAPKATAKHIIPFTKLSKDHASLLLKKYLEEFRLEGTEYKDLHPFSDEVVKAIGELAEYNAGRILKIAYDLLEHAVDDQEQNRIDVDFLNANRDSQEIGSLKATSSIEGAETTDLMQKADEA